MTDPKTYRVIPFDWVKKEYSSDYRCWIIQRKLGFMQVIRIKKQGEWLPWQWQIDMNYTAMQQHGITNTLSGAKAEAEKAWLGVLTQEIYEVENQNASQSNQ